MLQQNNLYEYASPGLRERVRKQLTPAVGAERVTAKHSRRWFLLPTFGILAGATAALAVMFFVARPHPQPARITAELIDAHVRSLQAGHLTDVLSTDQHPVKPWFDGKLDFIPPVADYSEQGLLLVGGRLDVIGGQKVAALVYSRNKHLINLFVWPYREDEPGFGSSGSRQGYNWATWQSGEMRFCLISDATPSDIAELKALIHP
jgi:anti-sigma factor RsiW